MFLFFFSYLPFYYSLFLLVQYLPTTLTFYTGRFPRLPFSSLYYIINNRHPILPTMTIHDLAFNQDFTCLLMSTDECHKIFNCDPFGEFYLAGKDTDNGATAFLRMLFSTSLTIMVPDGGAETGKRVLKVFNLKQNLKICELTFPLNIVDLMLNRKRMIVFLEVGQIYIYDLSSIRLIKVLEINSFIKKHEDDDLTVVADLSPDDNSYLVLPLLAINEQTDLFNTECVAGTSQPDTPVLKPSDSRIVSSLDELIEFTQKNKQSSLAKQETITLEDLQKDSPGWILVYDTINLRPRLIYKAHDAGIAKVAISNTSGEIATASTKGTIIRVCHLNFELLDHFKKLKISHVTNLRRGHNLSTINALKFNVDSTILGCSSESNTIHFFQVDADSSANADDEEEAYSSDEDAKSGRSSQEDLNENLASLLVLKRPDESPVKEAEHSNSYFSAFRRSSKILNNLYTKLIMKKLPYRDYLDNLLWTKPRRSFAYIKLPEQSTQSRKKYVEIGFSGSGSLMLASYITGTFYHYQLPKPHGGEEREKCVLLSQNSLLE